MERGVEGVCGAGPHAAQERLEFAPGRFDGVEVRRVRRQKEQPASGPFDQIANTVGLVHMEIIQADDLARVQRRGQDVLEGESQANLSADCPGPIALGAPQPVRRP